LTSKKCEFSKHWAILVRDTVYELARDHSISSSGVKLSATNWQDDVRMNFDHPIKVGKTKLSEEEILEIGMCRVMDDNSGLI